MFKFVLKLSQRIGDHPLWPCQLRVVSNFVCHSSVNGIVCNGINYAINILIWLVVSVVLLDMPTHKGEYSYHSKLPLAM